MLPYDVHTYTLVRNNDIVLIVIMIIRHAVAVHRLKNAGQLQDVEEAVNQSISEL